MNKPFRDVDDTTNKWDQLLRMQIVDELTYRSYAWNRTLKPEITPTQWMAGFYNVSAMEQRYQHDVKEGLYRPLGALEAVK